MRRWELIEAVKASLWKRGKVEIPLSGGRRRKIDAVSFGGWTVHREGGLKTGKWSVTHIPTQVTWAQGLATQRYAKQLVADMIERYPRVQDAETERRLRPYERHLKKLIRHYQQGVVSDQGKKQARSAPQASSRDTERLRRLADLGDVEAKAELRRSEVRAGKKKAERPVGRVSDIRPSITSALQDGLSYIGRQSGKAGVFYGKRNYSRAVSVGATSVIANVYQVGIKHYPSLRGKPRIESRWVMQKEYPFKEITDEQIAALIRWAKAAVPTKDLRSQVREKLEKKMQKKPGKSSYYTVVYG